MKIRLIALAGVAAMALSTSAFAAEPGWYLGLGAGYSKLNSLSAAPGTGNLKSSGSVAGEAAFGYSFGNGLRLEDEIGYSQHDMKANPGGTASGSVIAGGGREQGLVEAENAEVLAVANAHGATPAQVRLAWTLHRGPHVLAIPGTSNADHLVANVAAGALRLSADEVTRLAALR